MYTPLEERVIDPTREELVALLDRATRTANGRLRGYRVDKGSAAWVRFVKRHSKAPDGHVTYKGNRSSMTTAAKVTVAWWTDPLGRKHWRVRGGRTGEVGYWGQDRALKALGLWHVYPDRLMFRRRGKEETAVAACACGEVGPLDALCWVGPSCGPCHDRQEEGEPCSGPRHPVELPGHGDRVRVMTFAPDGRLLVADLRGRVVLWDLESREGKTVHTMRDTFVACIAVAATGRAALQAKAQDQILVADLNDEPPRWRPRRVPCGYVHGVQFSPTGRRLVVSGSNGVFVLDPAGGAARQVLRGRAVLNLEFLDDHGRVMACDCNEGVVYANLETGAVEPGRQGPRGGEGYELYDLIMTRSPDGLWMVCEGHWEDDTRMYLYHVPTERWLPLPTEEMIVTRVVGFSRRGELLTLHEESELGVWDVERQALVGRVQMHGVIYTGEVALSPDGELLATVADARGTVRVWPWRRLLG